MRAATSMLRSVRGARAAMSHRLAMQSRAASSLLRMPAMSPTMTEGGIASWKKNEGESFEAGDVILEIETDKATIDVEAQDDGVMGKIVFQAGSKGVPVGEVIAVLAEEGDDLSKLEVPSDLAPKNEAVPTTDAAPAKEEKKEETKAEAPAAPKHRKLDASKRMFPGVANMLYSSTLSDEAISKIKGTGRHGMITKGDILAAEGKISSPFGSAAGLVDNPMGPSGRRANDPKEPPKGAAGGAAAPAKEKPLTGAELRRLIVSGMSKATAPPPPAPKFPTATVSEAEFDDLLSDYATLLPSAAPTRPAAAAKDELDGLA